jgi:hypothetical protein
MSRLLPAMLVVILLLSLIPITTLAATVTQTVGVPPIINNPPVWPAGSTLTASGTTRTSTTLSWTPAQDDTAVTSYRLYQAQMRTLPYCLQVS